jgi:hypothetical protein
VYALATLDDRYTITTVTSNSQTELLVQAL